ncbi:MAG: hypothetical protein IT559_00205 [Alphaproteobacteria bacterium]|nr:hypothetical protein [Alphaproteobacteria bacterium]
MGAAFILSQVKQDSVRFAALCAAILIYAFYGSPTPETTGWPELFVGFLLVLSVSLSGCFSAFRINFSGPLWHSAGQILLIFGLTVPLGAGVFSAYDARLILRDIVPFFFMCLPVFLAPLVSMQAERFRVLLCCVLVLGVVFSIRAAQKAGPLGFLVPFLGPGEQLYYLANMPDVLFSALFFAGSAIVLFVRVFSPGALVRGTILSGLALVCLWPMAMAQQRAGVGVFVLVMLLILFFSLRDHPRRTIGFLALGVVLALVFCRAELLSIWDVLLHKNEAVGMNMRFQEVSAVWAEISHNPFSLLFGQGWGARFSSPAVAGITVNYTHGLFSSLLLKTGLAGLLLGVVYIGGILRNLLADLRLSPVFVLALSAPIAIDVLLYASFKSLDFGLVLLLAVAGGAKRI